MDKNIHPLAAVLVVCTAVLTLVIWFWGTGEARKLGGPAGLTVSPDGRLFIQIQNQLVEHGPAGVFVTRHDLAELGVHTLLGGTAFFPDGSILLRRGRDNRSLADTVRAFLRRTNTRTITSNAAETGLYRCILSSKRCELFGETPIDFKSASSVYIDQETNDVYISDSSRHLVRKYSSAGIAAAEPATGFKFPNQLLLHAGHLYIADTNNHRISVVHAASKSFGNHYVTADVVPALARASSHVWPTRFARIGDEWWVINMQNGMSFGGIYVFSDDWQYKYAVDLPGKADPVSLVIFNDEVLVSDWYGDRIHRVSTSGEFLGDFASDGLRAVLQESTAKRTQFKLIAWVTALFGATLIVCIVIKGTNWNRKVPPKRQQNVAQSDEPLVLEPDAANIKNLHGSMRLLRWLLIPLVVVGPAVVALTDDTQAALVALLGSMACAGMVFAAGRVMQNYSTSSIRIEGNTVTLRGHTGRQVRNPLADVFFTENLVLSGNIAIFLQFGKTPIYDHDSTLRELKQRLPVAQHISHWTMQKKLVAAQHPFGLIGLATMLALLIVALLLLVQD